MKKFIMLCIAITIFENSYIAAASAITKVPKSVLPKNFPGLMPANQKTDLAGLVSTPQVHLSAAQIETLTANMSKMGAKDYLPQIQQIWEANPEMIYNAQMAVKNADIEAQRNYINELIKQAKTFKTESPELFSVQDAIATNSQLKNLVNQELPTTLQSINTEMSNLIYAQHVAAESTGTQKLFNILLDNVRTVEKNVESVLKNSSLSPQQAASQIGKLASELSSDIANADGIEMSSKNPRFKQSMSQVTRNLESTQDTLQNIKNILQKTSSSQSRTATYNQLKESLESFNAPSSEGSSIVKPSIENSEIAIKDLPTQITPYLSNQKSAITQSLSKINKSATLLSKYIRELDLQTQQKLFLIKETKDLISSSQVLNELVKNIQNAQDLATLKELEVYLAILLENFIKTLTILKTESKKLLHSEQQEFLSMIQNIINELRSTEYDFKSIILELEEINANKEALAQFKKELDLKEWNYNIQKDLISIQDLKKELSTVLTSHSGQLLKTDKAPMSMLEVTDKAITDYFAKIEEIKNTKDLKDLGILKKQLAQKEATALQNLDSLFGKIAYLPTSVAKNQALDVLRKIKAKFLSAKNSVLTIFSKAENIQGQHLFVNIEKNKITIALSTILGPSEKAFRWITQEFPASKMNSEQQKALADLERFINMAQSDIKKINAAQTTFEVDQLTKEFMQKQNLLRFIKHDKALIPFEGKTSLIPADANKSIISISEPSLAIPSGSNMATPVGKSYYPENSLVPFAGNDLALNQAKQESSLILLATNNLALNQAKKAFNIDIVVALVAGVITLKVITVDTEDSNEQVSIEKNIETNVFGNIKKPTTSTEFNEESEKILETLSKINDVPTAKLPAILKDLSDSLKILNLSNFKQEAKIFISKLVNILKQAYINAKESMNSLRAKVIYHWERQIEIGQQEIEDSLRNAPTTTTTKKSNLSTVEEIRNILAQWLQ